MKMSFSVQYAGTLDNKKVSCQVRRPETVRLGQTQPWKIDSYAGSIDVPGPLPDNG